MNDIVQMSKGETNFYPKTKVQAILGLQDSLVGTNLYTDTRDFDNPDAWSGWSNWYKTGEKFNGLTVMATDQDWNGLRQTIQVKKGEAYTYSTYARYKSGTGKSSIIVGNNTVGANPNNSQVSLDTTWKRVSFTTSVTADGAIDISLARTDNNTNTLLVAGIKLEKGSVATDYSVNPLDYLGSEGVHEVVSNAIKGITGIKPTDLSNYPTKSDVATEISSAVSGIKQEFDITKIGEADTGTGTSQVSQGGTKSYPQDSDVQTAITNALKNYLTTEGVQAKIAEQIKANQPDLSSFQKASDVQNAITNALKDYLTTESAQAEIAKQIKANQPDLSNYPTKSDVTTEIAKQIQNSAVSGAKPDLSNYPTKSEMTTAITNAKPDLSSFVTMAQVQSAVTRATEGLSPDVKNYLTKSEALSEITSAVNSAIAKAGIDITKIGEADTGTDASQISTGGEKSYPQDSDIQTAITNALKNYLTTEGVQAEIAKQMKTSGFQNAGDVQNAISNSLKDYLTTESFQTEIVKQIKANQPDLSNYPTKSEMTTAITNATPNVSSFVTMTQVQNAIAKATDGLSSDMKNYLTKSESLSEITSAVNSAIAKDKPDLSNYQTSEQVQTAITNALKGYLNTDGVQAEIAKQIKANQPDLSGFQKASDVQNAITNAIKGIKPTDLSNYPTKSDVTTEIGNAISGIKPTDLSNYPTKSDLSSFVTMTQVQNAVTKATEGLKPDLTNYLTKDEAVTQITSVVNSAIAKAGIDITKIGEANTDTGTGTDTSQISQSGTKAYPQDSDVQNAITNALKDYLTTDGVQAEIAKQIKANQPDLSNYPTRSEMAMAIKELQDKISQADSGNIDQKFDTKKVGEIND